MHLDVRRPRRDGDVAAQPEPAVSAGRLLEPEASADRRVQAVGGHEVGEPLAVDQHVVAAGVDALDRAGLDLDPGRHDGVGERRVEHGPADAASVAVPEVGLDPVTRRRGRRCPRSGGRPGRRRGRPGRRRRRASAPRRTPCRPGRAAARGPRRRARRGRRRARWPGRPVRHLRCTGRRHRDRARVGKRRRGRRSRPDADGEQARVEHGEHEGGDPAGVDQRERDPLDDDGDVVGVRDPAVGTASDRREAGDDDHPGVPLPAEGARCTTSAAPG